MAEYTSVQRDLLQQAFAIAHRASEQPECALEQRNKFRKIALLIWEAHGEPGRPARGAGAAILHGGSAVKQEEGPVTPQIREDLLEALECTRAICENAGNAPWDAWASDRALDLRHSAEELLGHVKAVSLSPPFRT